MRSELWLTLTPLIRDPIDSVDFFNMGVQSFNMGVQMDSLMQIRVNHLHQRSVFQLGLISLGLMMLMGCSNPELKLGEQVYTGTCKACHAGGINGAPILGNTKMWSKRAPQGVPVLVEHASNGYGLMPAKGGNTDLTQQEITAAVKFMLSRLE